MAVSEPGIKTTYSEQCPERVVLKSCRCHSHGSTSVRAPAEWIMIVYPVGALREGLLQLSATQFSKVVRAGLLMAQWDFSKGSGGSLQPTLPEP